MATNENIFVGDSFSVVVSWFTPNTENPYITSDAVISSAHVRLVRNRDRAVLVADEVAEIDGNETTFMIEPTLTTATGSYSAYMTAEFNDGSVLTQKVEFNVLPKT